MEKTSKEPNDRKDKQTSTQSRKKYHDYLDRIFKKCLRVSSKLTVMLINELYGKNYPLNSKVEFLNTEYIDPTSKKSFADARIRINDKDEFLLEMTSYYDSTLPGRFFGYCCFPALENYFAIKLLRAPLPLLIVLYERKRYPKFIQCSAESFAFSSDPDEWIIPVYAFLHDNWVEQRLLNLAALIPFQLIRMKKAIKKERSEKNIEDLNNLVERDIMGIIETCIDRNILSNAEASALIRLAQEMYQYLFGRYDELNVKEGVNEELNEFMTNEIIRLYDEHDKKLKEEFDEANEKLRAENSQIRAEYSQVRAENSQMRTENSQMRTEISRLGALLRNAGIAY